MINLRRIVQRVKKILKDGVDVLVNEILVRLKIVKMKIQKDLVDIEHVTVV
jgi:hypothetical protein